MGEDQKRSISKVREVFADDYASAKTAPEKQRLAMALFEESKKTRESADAWALMCEAVRLAADAGDVVLCLEIVDVLAGRYRVDNVQLRLDALTTLAEKATPQSAETIARHSLNIAASTAQSDGKIESKALQLSATMARKAKNPQLTALITQTQSRRRREELSTKELNQALARVKQDPDDAKACLEAGSLLCFTRGDWDSGLPLLARGSDPALASLAREEAALGDDATKAVAVAERWAEWAEGQKVATREGAELHAKELFARVVARLDGLERTRIQKQMATLATASSGLLHRAKEGPRSIPGLLLWLDASDPSAFTDGAAGPKRTNNDRVAKWRDLSGLGNDALQADPTKQPRRLSTAVAFDGNEFLSLANPLHCSAVTVLAVYRSTKTTADTTLASTRTASSSGWTIDHQAGGIWLRGFSESIAGQASVSPPSPEGKRVFLGVIDESGRLLARVEGARPATSDKKLLLKPSPTPLAVGGKTGDSGGGHFKGELQRLLIFSRGLTDTEIDILLTWNSRNMLP